MAEDAEEEDGLAAIDLVAATGGDKGRRRGNRSFCTLCTALAPLPMGLLALRHAAEHEGRVAHPAEIAIGGIF